MIGRRVPPAYAPVSPLGWIGGSDAVPELETLLVGAYEAAVVRLYGSGTQALRMAVRLAAEVAHDRGASRGGGVAVPAFSCFDVASAVVAEAERTFCYDLDPATLAPDEDSLRGAIRAGARVVVVAPLYGVPVPWEPLRRLAADEGAILVEDAAQGHGARWRDRLLGTLADISVLSFGRGKGWTGGAGGALLVRGVAAERAADLARPPARGGALPAVHALAQWALGRPAFYALPAGVPWLGLGETVYRPATGQPGGMPASAARMALATRLAAADEAAVRRRRGAWLRARLDPSLPIRPPPGSVAGELRLAIRWPGGWQELGQSALRSGVAPSYPRLLPTLPALAPLLSGSPNSWPGAAALVRELVTLPTHSLLRRHDAEKLLRVFHIDRLGAGRIRR